MPDLQVMEYPFTRMRVVRMAVENAIMARDLMDEIRPSPRLRDQLEGSSSSVYSNASEAEWAIYRKVKLKALGIAVSENHEFAAQIMDLTRGGPHPLHDRINHVGRMLSNWIKHARAGHGDA